MRAIAARFTHDTVVSPSAPAFEALRKLQANGVGHPAGAEGAKLMGTVSEANFVRITRDVREELAGPGSASRLAPRQSGR